MCHVDERKTFDRLVMDLETEIVGGIAMSDISQDFGCPHQIEVNNAMVMLHATTIHDSSTPLFIESLYHHRNIATGMSMMQCDRKCAYITPHQ